MWSLIKTSEGFGRIITAGNKGTGNEGLGTENREMREQRSGTSAD
jgi:hypothetical protein